MKIAIPDMISNSYFPAAAAVELGFFKDEGLDMTLELIYPVNRTLEVLRDGGIDFVGGSAHSTPFAFPGLEGRQAPRRAGAEHLLVPDPARRPQGEEGRHQRHQGPEDRRRAAGRPRPQAAAGRVRHRRGARQREDRAGADGVPGRRRDQEFRRRRRQGVAGRRDRRLLGERHGRGGRGARRLGHHGDRRAPRRRAAEGDPLHHAGAASPPTR